MVLSVSVNVNVTSCGQRLHCPHYMRLINSYVNKQFTQYCKQSTMYIWQPMLIQGMMCIVTWKSYRNKEKQKNTTITLWCLLWKKKMHKKTRSTSHSDGYCGLAENSNTYQYLIIYCFDGFKSKHKVLTGSYAQIKSNCGSIKYGSPINKTH